MSREILFQAKTVDTEEWVEGYYYRAKYYRTDDTMSDFITVPHSDEAGRPSEVFMVKRETVRQYTNRDAVNGKIFEGDILQTPSGAMRVVESTGPELVLHNNDGRRSTWAFAQFLKIIGNIWDNPEILKGTRYEKK